jgi:hypothetical protein
MRFAMTGAAQILKVIEVTIRIKRHANTHSVMGMPMTMKRYPTPFTLVTCTRSHEIFNSRGWREQLLHPLSRNTNGVRNLGIREALKPEFE